MTQFKRGKLMSKVKKSNASPPSLKRGDNSPDVARLQELLSRKGFVVGVDGDFGLKTYQAVRAYQAANVDEEGHPLVVDGKVGPLTWWSLNHDTPMAAPSLVVDFTQMPSESAGASSKGWAALRVAIDELKLGAGEEGGNNAGAWVRKYLQQAGLDEGQPWCASFVSWCYMKACGGIESMPFRYRSGARQLLQDFKKKQWANAPGQGYEPVPGDLVFWWRVRADGWQGHVGLVYQLRDGRLYTIEGNKTSKVQGFSYVFSRMEQLLGFGHVPD